jgi:asparagine synthase (glutamine-hydrolysing)
MCGILGMARFDGRPIDLQALEASQTSLRHRGPDDEGSLLFDVTGGRVLSVAGRDSDPNVPAVPFKDVPPGDWCVAIGHRRLAILDLTSAGHQPMSSADGRFWITFNGEIYNYLELREELAHLHSFRTGSDTEVLIAAFAAWGPDMLQRLVGMYAFCILDRQERRLFLARDPFGIKPLYFTNSGGRFAFASEIKALERLGVTSRSADPEMLYSYLRYGERSAGERTLFADVSSCPAAHAINVDLRG